MPPAKFQMSEELRAKIKAKGDFFDISKDFVDKCYEEKGIEETHRAYAERLKRARGEMKYSQKDLAKAIGCSIECISRIERQKNTDIDVERLQVIAYILNVTPHYLIGAVDKWDHSAFYNEKLHRICEMQEAIHFYEDKELEYARRYASENRLNQVGEMQE